MTLSTALPQDLPWADLQPFLLLDGTTLPDLPALLAKQDPGASTVALYDFPPFNGLSDISPLLVPLEKPDDPIFRFYLERAHEEWGLLFSRAAGTRLSTVFFRVNLAGALFTVPEFGGTWLHNRHNISAHDKWLKTTPWSLDSDERGDYSLDEYQHYLGLLLHAPFAHLGPNPHDSLLKNLFLRAKPSDIHLTLPGVKLSDFQPPLSGKPSHRLGIGAHRLFRPLDSHGVARERKDVISDEVTDTLQVVQAEPLILCLQYPPNRNAPMAPVVETLELAVCVQTLNAQGEWISRTHFIHLNPRGEGHFPALSPKSVTEPPPLLLVDTHLLEPADHVQKK